jgi:hypothetical protein
MEEVDRNEKKEVEKGELRNRGREEYGEVE